MTRAQRILAIVLASLIATFFAVQSFRWAGHAGAERAHRKFLGHVEDRRWSRCHGMISEAYSDRWGFDRKDISLALQDVGGQFIISLTIDWTTREISPPEADEGHAVIGTMRLDGRGGPAVDYILREARAFTAQPFTFRWRREGLMPWSWKLVSIDHPTVEVPAGYTPGDLGSAASARI